MNRHRSHSRYWKAGVVIAAIVIGGFVGSGRGGMGTAAQEAPSRQGHPLVGTWIVDTDGDTVVDAPEVGIFTADDSVFGLGASRWVFGA